MRFLIAGNELDLMNEAISRPDNREPDESIARVIEESRWEDIERWPLAQRCLRSFEVARDVRTDGGWQSQIGLQPQRQSKFELGGDACSARAMRDTKLQVQLRKTLAIESARVKHSKCDSFGFIEISALAEYPNLLNRGRLLRLGERRRNDEERSERVQRRSHRKRAKVVSQGGGCYHDAVMSIQTEVVGALARAKASLERWQVVAARQAAERANALASNLGDANGVAMSRILLARAQLLTCADPTWLLLPDDFSSLIRDPGIAGALARFRAELAAASGAAERSSLEVPSPPTAVCTDALAAWALEGIRLLERSAAAKWRPLAAQPADADAQAWSHLASAIDAEFSGTSGWSHLTLALDHAEREGLLSVAWTALRLRRVLCERRGVHGEGDATSERARALLNGWLLTLPQADALTARTRFDRIPLLDIGVSRSEAVASATTLVETAVALALERDIDKLVNLTLDAALGITAADRGMLVLAGPKGGHRVAAIRHLDETLGGAPTVGLSSTIVSLALEKRQVVISNDVRRDPRFSDCDSLVTQVTGVLCVPILARAEVEGALYLDRRGDNRSFESAAIDGARALGAMLASSLLNARILEALETRGKQLEVAREELTLALASRTAERDDISRQLADTQGATLTGTDVLIGNSVCMQRLRRKIETVAKSDAPVLIAGETGSGKELVARAIHLASHRRDFPFVAINCGALSESLFTAELFGATRGAYTGATATRPGLLVTADKGTVLLDEVGDMPPAVQTALLRVLETAELRAIGSNHSTKIDVRIIAASHRDLVELVKEGKFRDDLRYRLEVVRMEVPPLRERLDDLPELCEALLADVRRRYNLAARRLSPDAMEALRARHWTGNVRELRHTLASGALASSGPFIVAADLPAERSAASPRVAEVAPVAADADVDGHALRAEAIRRALKATAGHRGQAAKLLGMSRSSFYRYCESYGIEIAEAARSSIVLERRKQYVG